jgi:hypothetical protein
MCSEMGSRHFTIWRQGPSRLEAMQAFTKEQLAELQGFSARRLVDAAFRRRKHRVFPFKKRGRFASYASPSTGPSRLNSSRTRQQFHGSR